MSRVLRQPNQVRETAIVVAAHRATQHRGDVVAGMDFLEALRRLGAPVRMRGGVGVLYLVGQALRGRLGSSIAGRREAVGIAAILVAMVLLAAMRAAGRIGLDRGLGAHFRAIRLWGRSVVRAAE